MKLYVVFLFFAAGTLLSGCAWLREAGYPLPGSLEFEETQAIVSRLKNCNEDLKTFKGIGKAEFKDHRRGLRFVRAAWTCERPDKIRFEIMGIPGQPALSISFDGKHFYFLSHADGEFYQSDSREGILEDIMSISVKADHIMEMLAGRVPVDDFDFAKIDEDDFGKGYRLALEKDWFGKKQIIYLDKSKTKVNKFEVFDFAGSLEYRAEFPDIQSVDGFMLPRVIVLSNDDGAVFRLETQKCFVNVPVSSSAFIIRPYESFEKSYRP